MMFTKSFFTPRRSLGVVAAALLALPVALATVMSFASVNLPQSGADYNAGRYQGPSLPTNEALEISRNSVAERVFQSGLSWGDADAEVYARIAAAFKTEPLRGAELKGVKCRGQLCRVSFRAAPDLPVRKLLPMQLAEVFGAIVTVHEGGPNRVYVDLPNLQ